MSTAMPHVLIVEDDAINRDIILACLDGLPCTLGTAEDGDIAWRMLQQEPERFDLILLDKIMPNMGGMEVLNLVRQHPILQHCPVVLQTGQDSVDEVSAALDAGAHYYLTKPFSKKVLQSVVNTALRDRNDYMALQQQLQQTQLSLGLMKNADFQFQTLEQARSIALLIANACPEPHKIAIGLTELMINAIEHGNLGISYDDKTVLNEAGTWEWEVHRRLQLPENCDKYAAIQFVRNHRDIEIQIKDQGPGFDWQSYLEFDPLRIMDNHGRGIAVANKLSFTRLTYRATGNEVCATIEL